MKEQTLVGKPLFVCMCVCLLHFSIIVLVDPQKGSLV